LFFFFCLLYIVVRDIFIDLAVFILSRFFVVFFFLRPGRRESKPETHAADLEGARELTNLADISSIDDDGIEFDDPTDAQIYTFHGADTHITSDSHAFLLSSTAAANSQGMDSHDLTSSSHDLTSASRSVGGSHSSGGGAPDSGVCRGKSAASSVDGEVSHHDTYTSDAESDAAYKHIG
jgi:hypothetical protein